MNGEDGELQTFIVELRTFIVGTEIKLQNIEERISKLADNSKGFQELAQDQKLFQQQMEQEWKFHRAHHENLAKEMKGVREKMINLRKYVLIAIILGVGGGSLLVKLGSLIPF